MRPVLDLVDAEAARLAGHPLLARLEAQAPWAEVRELVPALAFWVLAAPDLTELCAERMQDPALRAAVDRRPADERYLDDLRRLGEPLPDVAALFGPGHEAARRASYTLAAEVIRAPDDRVRLALVWVVDAAQGVLHERAAAYRHWPAPGLRYFSDRPADPRVRLARRLPGGPEATGAVVRAASAVVRRGFSAFHVLFDGARSPRAA